MDNKNLTSPANDSVISITAQDLSAELVELSEEVLSQVRGGAQYLDPIAWEQKPPINYCYCCGCFTDPIDPFPPLDSLDPVYPIDPLTLFS